MAALALQKLFDITRDAGTVQAQALDTRIRSALSQFDRRASEMMGAGVGLGTRRKHIVSPRLAFIGL